MNLHIWNLILKKWFITLNEGVDNPSEHAETLLTCLWLQLCKGIHYDKIPDAQLLLDTPELKIPRYTMLDKCCGCRISWTTEILGRYAVHGILSICLQTHISKASMRCRYFFLTTQDLEAYRKIKKTKDLTSLILMFLVTCRSRHILVSCVTAARAG